MGVISPEIALAIEKMVVLDRCPGIACALNYWYLILPGMFSDPYPSWLRTATTIDHHHHLHHKQLLSLLNNRSRPTTTRDDRTLDPSLTGDDHRWRGRQVGWQISSRVAKPRVTTRCLDLVLWPNLTDNFFMYIIISYDVYGI
ncbi:3-dehydroquinate synthase [Striga asiatica]|uniref:3-dehydroquinate synthase n=1 Tax=Striga asiatica TaxID=4170 RepID=A0A5A7PQP9_STRAF|nr:3-dehydroquinate synthase [Striga asiatica]